MFTFALHVLPSYLVAEDDELYAMTRTPTISAISFVPWNHVFLLFIFTSVLILTWSCLSVYLILFLFCTSVHLYFMLPHKTEGGLAMYRSALVQNKHLSQLAKVNHRHVWRAENWYAWIGFAYFCLKWAYLESYHSWFCHLHRLLQC